MFCIFFMSRSCGFEEQFLEVWQPALCSTSSGEYIILLCSDCVKWKSISWQRKYRPCLPSETQRKHNFIQNTIYQLFWIFTCTMAETFLPGEHLVYCLPGESTTGHWAVSRMTATTSPQAEGQGLSRLENPAEWLCFSHSNRYVQASMCFRHHKEVSVV